MSKYVVNTVSVLIYMGAVLESIKSKPVSALSGCFQLRRPSVCISSMLKGKLGPCFLPINLYLSIFIYLCITWSRGQFEYIFTFAESSVVILTNFTCSSLNSVDVIKSFIFIELKVKGVV